MLPPSLKKTQSHPSLLRAGARKGPLGILAPHTQSWLLNPYIRQRGVGRVLLIRVRAAGGCQLMWTVMGSWGLKMSAKVLRPETFLDLWVGPEVRQEISEHREIQTQKISSTMTMVRKCCITYFNIQGFLMHCLDPNCYKKNQWKYKLIVDHLIPIQSNGLGQQAVYAVPVQWNMLY